MAGINGLTPSRQVKSQSWPRMGASLKLGVGNCANSGPKKAMKKRRRNTSQWYMSFPAPVLDR